MSGIGRFCGKPPTKKVTKSSGTVSSVNPIPEVGSKIDDQSGAFFDPWGSSNDSFSSFGGGFFDSLDDINPVR